MQYANISHHPDVDLPDEAYWPCPDDVVASIEEFHEGLHKVMVAKEIRRNSYRPIGTIICQTTKDKRARPEATPDELGEYVMQWLQYEVDESDSPGRYRVTLVGPPGKGAFKKSKHIDLSDPEGNPRTMTMLNEGDLLEQQTAYIGELHSQVVGMIELLTGAHKTVVNENREMMKILSEATRKHAEIERDRLTHQLNMKMHEDQTKAEEAESERAMRKFEKGMAMFKETGAAEELIRAVAKKIQGVKDGIQNAAQGVSEAKPKTEPSGLKAAPATPPEQKDDDPTEAPTPPRSAKGRFTKTKKTTKKKNAKKKASKKDVEKPEKTLEDVEPAELDEELQAMIEERPYVMAAEALQMTINEKKQWRTISKILSDEQQDILDDIFASTTDEDVIKNAQRLASAPGMMNLAKLQGELDEQQKTFIGLIMKHVSI
jgi:hypothetical protein